MNILPTTLTWWTILLLLVAYVIGRDLVAKWWSKR